MEVPLNESAPTLEAAPEAEVPATMSPMEVPPESAPIDIAAEVPATQSSPVEEVPPESAPLEVAAEVPATQSSPVEVPPESLPIEVAAEVPATQLEVPPAVSAPSLPEDPKDAQVRPNVERRFSLSEDSQNPFPNPEHGDEKAHMLFNFHTHDQDVHFYCLYHAMHHVCRSTSRLRSQRPALQTRWALRYIGVCVCIYIY